MSGEFVFQHPDEGELVGKLVISEADATAQPFAAEEVEALRAGQSIAPERLQEAHGAGRRLRDIVDDLGWEFDLPAPRGGPTEHVSLEAWRDRDLDDTALHIAWQFVPRWLYDSRRAKGEDPFDRSPPAFVVHRDSGRDGSPGRPAGTRLRYSPILKSALEDLGDVASPRSSALLIEALVARDTQLRHALEAHGFISSATPGPAGPTDDGRQIIAVAARLAMREDATELTTAHVLQALAARPDSDGAAWLHERGIDDRRLQEITDELSQS